MSTTVSAGKTVAFEIGPFDTLTLTSSRAVGVLTLTSQAPKLIADQSLSVQNGTFGPYGAPMSVSMSVASGSATYEVNTQSLTATDARAAKGLVSGAANYGGEAFIYIDGGDSMENNAILTTGTAPDGKVVAPWHVRGATENYWRSWGWPAWVGALTLQRGQVIGSTARQTNGLVTEGTNPAGVPFSVQSAQARSDPLYARKTRWLKKPGFNDSAFSIAVMKAALMSEIALSTGPGFLMSPPPRSDSAATVVGGDGMQDWLKKLAWRNELKRICDQSSGRIQFIDFYSACNTPTASPDGYATNYTFNAGAGDNGIHTSSLAGFKGGQLVGNALFPGGVGNPLDLWTTVAYVDTSGGANLLDQGFRDPTLAAPIAAFTASISGTTMTVSAIGSGSLAVGHGVCGAGITAGTFITAQLTGSAGSTGTYTVSTSQTVASASMYGVMGLAIVTIGTATFTLTQAANTIPGGVGNMLSIAITKNADGDGVDVTTHNMATSGGGRFLAENDDAWFQLFIRVNSGGVYPRNLFTRLQGFNGTNYYAVWCPLDVTKEPVALPFDGTTRLLPRTPVLTAPATAFSNLQGKFRPTFAGAGAGTCTIDISLPDVRRFRAAA